jgi:hypothetical protein
MQLITKKIYDTCGRIDIKSHVCNAPKDFSKRTHKINVVMFHLEHKNSFLTPISIMLSEIIFPKYYFYFVNELCRTMVLAAPSLWQECLISSDLQPQ